MPRTKSENMIKRQCVRLSKLSIKPTKRSKPLSARQSKNYPGVTPFKGNPEVYEELTKCASLALRDYNSKLLTNYRVLDIKYAEYSVVGVGGFIHNITCEARNSENELDTFQVSVYTKKNLEKGEIFMEVINFKIVKPKSIWHRGTLTELVAIHTK